MKSSLHIQTFSLNGSTQLGNCYFSPPFKVMNITEDRRGKDLHLMLMSSSPGVLDEDEYNLKVEVADHCSLQLHTQSYQRLFHMQQQAVQIFEARVGDNGKFIYMPHPSVPHENSSFTARNKVYLNASSQLIWGEVLTCGRKLNGEVFQFSKYHNITQIFLDNQLVIKENLLMQPALVSPNLMGQLEGFTHQASFIYFNQQASIKTLCDEVHEYLQPQENIGYGVTQAHAHALLVRIVGYKAEQLFNCLKGIAASIRSPKPVHHDA